ncbi:uncharacterized protein HRG_11620 [Hirsutella rhossiliensis]|uniref:Uncharacterized protein n=1 Tax=Hirsutella rhossiliensis TaxID=111463 RepID=A0A9P8MLJ4_9HYPO|nr:uncharacterized protein HRG_11620 [Hirsutella rhossiliensis]KAH0957473.1 hypothetical protein HRG_11620 [Hirsutella rhossiliensis]
MPRFSVAFSKRKSAADELTPPPAAPTEQPSFRVIERNDVSAGRSFDGGARMARASRVVAPQPNLTDLDVEENMFADLKANRGSGVSNTTNATSTDNSSRHSNASTAPSSTDLSGGGGQDDARQPTTSSSQESPSRGGSSKSSFLDRATRTFSFGGQKKHSIPPPQDNRVPDLPPILTLQNNNNNNGGESRSRGLTASTASTATPTNAEEANLDLGGDFGSMFTTFDKRASMATLKNDAAAEPRSLTGIRHVHSAPLSPDYETPAEPLLGRRGSPPREDDLSLAAYDVPPPVPRHQAVGSFKYSDRPSDIAEDEDAKLLQESFSAMKILSDPGAKSGRSQAHRYRRDEDTFSTVLPKSIASNFAEDNMFEGSLPRLPRASHRYVPRSSTPSQQNKVMTPAEFERYRQDKERQDTAETATQVATRDDEDDINYDDDEDEQEKSKQQMMKVTGEPASPPVARNGRSGLPPSSSAPQLSQMKSPSPDLAAGADDEDEDEDVPLGILQAHGFPARNRPPTRLSHAGSISNLRAPALGPRPASMTAFARHLPQDPFVGASLARPALRESLSFGDAGQLSLPQQGPLPPGGLVGVIASEERSRAMRRGSPSVDHKMPPGLGMNGPQGLGFDAAAGMPQHMVYGPGGMPMMHPMPMPPPMLTPGDQAQIQMTQQMQQFMQMQMHFMQMMAGNQGGGGHPMQPPMQPPYGAGLPGNLSMADLSSRHSMTGEPMAEPLRMEHGRTMSMVQPRYAPSIAPSERSNIGLPGRYRPVSHAPSSPALGHNRASTMSGGLSNWSDDKSKSTVKIVDKAGEGSDEDDEQGWAAMKAKREKKRSMWRSRKSFGSELAL